MQHPGLFWISQMKKDSTPDAPRVEAAIEFLGALFGGELSKGNIYLSSLANNDAPASEPGERRLATRDIKRVAKFIGSWDKPDRGLFFCVGTVTDRRAKDDIVETLGLHADIDFKGVEYTSV